MIETIRLKAKTIIAAILLWIRSHRMLSRVAGGFVLIIGIILVLTGSAAAPGYKFIEAKTMLQMPTFGIIDHLYGIPSKGATGKNTPGKSYGIAAGSSFSKLSDGELNARLADIKSMGATWIRFDFEWSNIQASNPDNYNWQTTDRLVAAANKNGLKVLGIIDYTPRWARADSCPDSDKCRPSDPNQFANFASTVAKRYAPQNVHSWEIWNEPNNPGFWQPKADPKAYTDLLKASYASIRAVDPTAIIITAGLSPQASTDISLSPIDFLQGIYDAGAKGNFDAVAHHPYTFPLSPSADADHAWAQMARDQNSLRSIMKANGDESKKIWITEYGSPTGGPGPIATIENPNLDARPYRVDEALQAKLLSDAVTEYKKQDWYGPFFYYTYKDSGDTNDTNENFFGLISFDGRKKPAYDTFVESARN